MKRELDANLYRFNIYLKLNSTRNFPLHIAMQSKNNKRKKMRKTSFYQSLYIVFKCKSITFY